MTIDSTVEDKISFGWGGSASALIDSVETEIVTCLKQKHEELQEDTASRSQVIAWESSLRSTKNAVAQLIATNQSYNNIGVIFEYELPRERGRRPDILLLTGEQILVLEFKEHSYPSRAFIDQVAAYARDIKNYHAASHELIVRPLLVLSNAQDLQEQHDDVEIVSANELSSVLENLITVPPKKLVDWSAWAGADYSPLPTIVAAARQLFLNESLPAIRRAQSAGIPETIRKLVEISNNSRTEKEKHLVLITGVPGAGKTLAGLQLVYENFFGDSGSERTAVVLSGNGRS